jgi:hypothetical protein
MVIGEKLKALRSRKKLPSSAWIAVLGVSRVGRQVPRYRRVNWLQATAEQRIEVAAPTRDPTQWRLLDSCRFEDMFWCNHKKM